jgi:hypothetical protein
MTRPDYDPLDAGDGHVAQGFYSIFDDAQAAFDFSVDAVTGEPAFLSAQVPEAQ